MAVIKIKEKSYEIDKNGFLVKHDGWDEDFAEETAGKSGISGGLTERHWRVIKFIRKFYEKSGSCPLVFETCRGNGLKLKELKELFPSGYFRGACKIAGLTYKDDYIKFSWDEGTPRPAQPGERLEKFYRVDAQGFLADAGEWDEYYAFHKAHELKMPEGLTGECWKIIRYLRQEYKNKGEVPTVYETCEANGMEISELAKLFPDGYHRGAVKLAGLRVA